MINRYKCRTEFQIDFFRFWNKFIKYQEQYERTTQEWTNQRKYYFTIIKCDVDIWTFQTEMTLKEIIQFTRDIEDCHILRQTVQLEDDFTNERDFSRL